MNKTYSSFWVENLNPIAQQHQATAAPDGLAGNLNLGDETGRLSNIVVPPSPALPGQRRLREVIHEHGLPVPVVICGTTEADRVSVTGDANHKGIETNEPVQVANTPSTQAESSGGSQSVWVKFPSEGKYNIVYADPAWAYTNKPGRRWVGNHYPLMSADDICRLPVNRIAAHDSVLFLWATFPTLPNAFKVIEAWGFEYKTVGFTWIKKCRRRDSLFWGCGYWTRANAEICLLAVKGEPKRVCASVHSVIETPIERHSKKPDIARTRIVQLCGDLPRIELFARQVIPGWDAWGNEVGVTPSRNWGTQESITLAV